MSALEDAVIEYLETAGALRAFVAELLSAPLSDRELIAVLMWLEGHSREAIARVMPRQDGGCGVSRQNVWMAFESVRRKLVDRGWPIESLDFSARYPQDVRHGRKWCARCGRLLPVRAFTRDRSAPSGLDQYCRECAQDMQATQRRRRNGRKVS